MRIKVIVSINARDLAKLEEIGESGKITDGYKVDIDYCLQKAIDDFIKNYGGV